jgi:hypothetical protein
MSAVHHSTHSTLRERIVEHVFVGEALRRLWKRGILDIEVLRSEFDAHGYDLVMVHGGTMRHIQFKTGTSSRPPDVSIARSLAAKPSGCVIWIRVTPDLDDLKPFFWFGGVPGQPLPSLDSFASPRRATHNKDDVRPERVNHCLVPKAKFERVDTLDEILVKLFGELR